MSPSNGSAGGTPWNGQASSYSYPYIGGAYVGGSGGSISYPSYPFVTTQPVITPFEDAQTILDRMMQGIGKQKITPVQLQTLMDSHQFVEMDTTNYCLFCYALDQYRTEADHQHMIREE